VKVWLGIFATEIKKSVSLLAGVYGDDRTSGFDVLADAASM
jgi:hypothetical protein